ncbi:hypothetical protein C1645_835499 [Glomus cerebriforme]|uniref:HTH myb-type domain-containing protein n=1 Tax=Glomus cerebriforme TaxID=658196 RepID=A0A397SBW7_9GLOM|nr:hypothetical protein C1645_835499 [Glomus cerebriforme]
MRSKEILFREEDNVLIRKYMKEYGHRKNRFALISKLLDSKFNNKQISEHWRNSLNPELCHEEFGFYEKTIIDLLVPKYQKSDKIQWKFVIVEMKIYFEKLYSENKIKNYWYSKNRNNNTKDSKSKTKTVKRNAPYSKSRKQNVI